MTKHFLRILLLFVLLPFTGCGQVVSDANPYIQACEALEQKRNDWAAEYLAASDQKRQSVLDEARKELLRFFAEDCFPAWYGTKWDFNGTTEVPGEGEIACGYFVSTTLQDAGFRMNRYRVAQQASQKIIEVFSNRDSIMVMVAKPVEEVATHIRESGPGIYIVGLDTHVGFVMNHNGELRFVHSSYYKPDAVVKSEPLVGRNPLADSNYRVVGKILSDQMIEKWLSGGEFVISA
ncbi:MAG: hypothetical protein CMO55_08695 [Verrucomicrobiales bacterium]|nr:hypothetical protein [Verrucomicrobiales bacterium]